MLFVICKILFQACTGGGCTTSEASNVTTTESAPAGIQGPVITSPSPSQLHVTWKEPLQPNGMEYFCFPFMYRYSDELSAAVKIYLY